MKRLQYIFASVALCGCVSTVSLKETSYYDQGKLALAGKSYDLAQVKFKLALRETETRVYALNGLAATYYEMNDHKTALEFVRSARLIDSESLYLKNNEARILARLEDERIRVLTPVKVEAALIGQVAISPAVVDLTPGTAMLSLQGGRPQIEVTSTRPAAGYERLLPTAQLEQIAPDVYNLVLAPRKEVAATANESVGLLSVLDAKTAPSSKAKDGLISTNSETIPAARQAAIGQLQRSNTRIAIANGAGIKGIACGAAGSLRKAGISVGSCTDYKTKDGKTNFKQTETVLYVNRDSKLDPELILALIHSCDAKRLVVTNLTSSKLDVQVVLGKDSRTASRRA
jgi:tetratricopeptide (TPR) repeat protein